MDKLKEYLLRSRDELDVDPPAGETWENIAAGLADEAGVPGKGVRRGVFSIRRVVRYSAAACVVLLAGVGLWWVMRGHKAPAVETAKQPVRVIRDPGRIERVLPKAPGADVARNAAAPQRMPHRVSHRTRRARSGGVSDQISAIDKSYSTLIDYQLKKLRATPLYAENGNYFSFYVDQFKQMDQDEQQVRNDIKAYGLTSEFLEQLINVYQQKLNLLKNLQTEINKVNNKVRENAAPSAKTEVYYLNI